MTSQLMMSAYGVPERVKAIFENRNYYEDNLKALFFDEPEGDRPHVPSGLIPAIIHKCVSMVLPEGTMVKPKDEAGGAAELLAQIVEDMRLDEKLTTIGTEGHVTGTVALKSVWPSDGQGGGLQRWTLDILPAEAIEVDHDPLDVEVIQSVRVRFRYEQPERGEMVRYWWQERWTATEYTEWIAQRDIEGKLPEFTDANINTETSGPHQYGEIPITLITHGYQLNSPYGESEITPTLKAIARELAIQISKQGINSQFSLNPVIKRINDISGGSIRIKPGAIIDLQGDGLLQPDMAVVDMGDIPPNSLEYVNRLMAQAYASAQVTNPAVEAEMTTGNGISSVAWKAMNFAFVKKIKRLRIQYGDKGIESHLEKVLRMGHAHGIPGHESINPEDATTYGVQMSYPEFFELTPLEKIELLNLYSMAKLPEADYARRIAMLLDIQDEGEIQAIAQNIADERAAMTPTPFTGGANE